MKNPLEQELVNTFIENIRKRALKEGVQCSFTQIESGATAIGIPDLLMFLDNKLYWIEVKRLKNVTYANKGNAICTFTGEIQFRPGQVRFLHKLYNAHERVFVLALTEYSDAIIIPIFHIPLETGTVYRVKEKGSDYPSTYTFMKEMIKE